MRRCLALASWAAENGETAVGAVVVRRESIIGEGAEGSWRPLDPTAHAEVLALRAACQREGTLVLTGCKLYTTVEPCILCSYAIRQRESHASWTASLLETRAGYHRSTLF